MNVPQNIPDAIAWFGLVAVINADFSGADLIEISDALSAAPLPIIAIAATSAGATSIGATITGVMTTDACDTIAALRARHGSNLTIGASHVETAAQFDAVCDAGAQFVLGGPADAGMAHRAPVAYIPRCTSADDVRAAQALGCAMLLRVLDTETAAPIPSDWPGDGGMPQVLVAGAVTADNVAAIARTSVAAVALGYEPIAAGQWSAAALIAQARRMRRIWETARRDG